MTEPAFNGWTENAEATKARALRVRSVENVLRFIENEVNAQRQWLSGEPVELNSRMYLASDGQGWISFYIRGSSVVPVRVGILRALFDREPGWEWGLTRDWQSRVVAMIDAAKAGEA